MINYLNEFKQYLIDFSEGEVSSNTISSYLTDIKHFLIYIKGKELPSIVSKDIIGFIGQPIFKPPFHPCSIKTRKRRLSSVRAFFSFLINNGIIFSNPVPFRLVKARHQKYLPLFLKPFEIEKVLDSTNDILTKTIVIFLFGTGVRLEEMRTCQIASLDLNKLEVKVLGKGNKERYVPFSKKISEKLKEYIFWRESIVKPGVTELFVSGQGTSLIKNQIEYMFRKLSKHSGIKIRPHKLRHSFATEAISRGINPKSLQRILGHESQVTTDWYTHIEPDVRGDYDRAFE